MTIDEQIARAKELIAKREEIDQQLAELFAGMPPAKKNYPMQGLRRARAYRKDLPEHTASGHQPR